MRASKQSELPELAVEALVMPRDDASWLRLRTAFAAHGLREISRFDAINGAELSDEFVRNSLTTRAAHELKVGRCDLYYWVHEGIPSKGAVGCYLSHVEMWKRAAERTIPTLILEQDAELIASPEEFLKTLREIPPSAEVAVLGHFPVVRPFPLSMLKPRPSLGFQPLNPEDDVYGSHSYVVTPAGARKLADRALPINMQVDSFLRLCSGEGSDIRMVLHVPSLTRQQPRVPSAVQPTKRNRYAVVQASILGFRALWAMAWWVCETPWRMVTNWRRA